MNKLNIEFIISEFKKEKYRLLSKEYEGAHSPLLLMCPNSHLISMPWQKWTRGRRCKYCNGSRIYFKDMDKSFKSEKYELLTKEEDYKNVEQKLEYICPKGHKGTINWSNWKKGSRCKQCYVESRRISFSRVKLELEANGYKVLSSDSNYKDSTTILHCVCDKGHSVDISWKMWKANTKCKVCALEKRDDKFRLGYSFVKSKFEKEGYRLLTTEYKNAHQKLDVVCPEGHKYAVRWNDWQQGGKCPHCIENGVSKFEKEVRLFLSNENVKYIVNDKTVLKNPKTSRYLELDIWMPHFNKAIECNGVYWHNKNQYRIDIGVLKQQLCKNQNIDLLIITDEEWYSKLNVGKNKLLYFIGEGVNI